MIRPRLLFLILCLAAATLVGQVKTGADLLFEKHFKLIEGKRVGLVTNHSALLSNGKHLVDAIHEDKRTKLVALFGPEHKIPTVVLDRPNPIRGTWVEGFNRDDSLRYLAGLQPVVIAEGMTVGELATMYNKEGWLKNGIQAGLTVVKMGGWKRTMWYDQTGLKVWVAPSPNLPTLASCVVYPGTCLFEGVNIAEGRGTERPFENIGAPFIDGAKWANMLNAYKLKGVKFEPVEFTPRSIEHVAMNPKDGRGRCGTTKPD